MNNNIENEVSRKKALFGFNIIISLILGYLISVVLQFRILELKALGEDFVFNSVLISPFLSPETNEKMRVFAVIIPFVSATISVGVLFLVSFVSEKKYALPLVGCGTLFFFLSYFYIWGMYSDTINWLSYIGPFSISGVIWIINYIIFQFLKYLSEKENKLSSIVLSLSGIVALIISIITLFSNLAK